MQYFRFQFVGPISSRFGAPVGLCAGDWPRWRRSGVLTAGCRSDRRGGLAVGGRA